MSRIERYYPNQTGRRSGRTFRAIVMALHDASEGAHVFYLSPNMAAAKLAQERAARIVKHIAVRISENTIRFPEGSIRFTTPELLDEDKTRGLGRVLIITDSF